MGESGGRGLIEEDDGMGGRLGAGAGGGGIITPYAFIPPAPVGGTGVVGGHQYQNPQVQQMSNVGVAGDGVGVVAAGYGNEKRAMRLHTPNASVSSGSHYPASSNLHYQNLTVGSPEPHSPTSDGVSVDGSGAYYRQSVGRGGPSPGPSVLSSSSGGGRHAKELEANGRIAIANPDDHGAGQRPGFQQAYLQTGPGPQHQRGLSSSSLTTTTNAVRSSQPSPTPSRGGTAVVVHEDGGRVVLRKGETEGEPEVLNTEIPPTYDSLPVDVRRES